MKKYLILTFIMIFAGIFIFSTAQGPVFRLRMWDTDNSHYAEHIWNENEASANRILNWILNAGNRTINLSGNLTLAGNFTTASAASIATDSGQSGKYLTNDGAGNWSWNIVSTTDEKVGIDSLATAGYLGAAYNDGVLRVTLDELTYTDGGDFITIGLANTATARTALGLAIGTNVQAYDADLTTYAGITPSANIQSFLGSADYATARTNLGVAIGSDVQAYDADLTTYAGITPSANVQALLAAADYAAFKTSLSLNLVENTALSTWAGTASITTVGDVTVASITGPAAPLDINTATVQDVNFWDTIASGNPSINIYGYNTAGSDLESGSFSMDDTNDEFVISVPNSVNNEGVTVQLNEANQAFRVRDSGGSVAMQAMAETDSIGGQFVGDNLISEQYYNSSLANGAFVNLLGTTNGGWGFVKVGDGEEYAQFIYTSAGVVTLIVNSANVVNTDTAAKFCIFDGGLVPTIKNNLGVAKAVELVFYYVAD